MPYLAQGLAWRTESVRVGGDGASGSGVDHPRVLSQVTSGSRKMEKLIGCDLPHNRSLAEPKLV